MTTDNTRTRRLLDEIKSIVDIVGIEDDTIINVALERELKIVKRRKNE